MEDWLVDGLHDRIRSTPVRPSFFSKFRAQDDESIQAPKQVSSVFTLFSSTNAEFRV